MQASAPTRVACVPAGARLRRLRAQVADLLAATVGRGGVRLQRIPAGSASWDPVVSGVSGAHGSGAEQSAAQGRGVAEDPDSENDDDRGRHCVPTPSWSPT